MNKKILITGATGFIGRNLVKAFSARGDIIYAVTRNTASAKNIQPAIYNFISWNELSSLKNEHINAFINLAGMNLAEKRWNEKVKKKIYNSRIVATKKLVELISIMDHKPEVLINASGVDYYGDTGDIDVYEDSPAGSSFAAKLTQDWEGEALKAQPYKVRVVLLRTGFVVGKGSSGLMRMALPFKLFVGGPPGTGKQYLSWIHIDDLVKIYLITIDNLNLKGAINATSPDPVTMKEFCKQLGKVLKRPSLYPVPGFMLRLLFGEIADVILSGRKALPGKLKELGFEFRYVNVYDALRYAFK